MSMNESDLRRVYRSQVENSLIKSDPERTEVYTQTRVSIQYDSASTAEVIAEDILNGAAPGNSYGSTPVSFTIREVKTLRWHREPRRVHP